MNNESNIFYSAKNIHRKAVVKDGKYFCEGKYVVSFYYDGFPDYEWKKGSHGVACDICDTLEQAKRKADYYVKKDNQ